MRVTIIPTDGFVSVDGKGINQLDLSFIDSSIHAIQWYDDEGEIEIKDNRGRTVRNEIINSIEPYRKSLDLWAAAKAKAELEEQDVESLLPN